MYVLYTFGHLHLLTFYTAEDLKAYAFKSSAVYNKLSVKSVRFISLLISLFIFLYFLYAYITATTE